jgi:hypothetical protein
MAHETGGLALINAQRIEALDSIGADVSQYYWVGFNPAWEADDSFHEIRLEHVNPALAVRTRTGYADTSRNTEIVMAMERALYFGGGSGSEFPVEIGEIERKGRREITVPVTVSIPLSRMNLQRGDDGTYVAQMALFMVALDDEGGLVEIPVEQLVITVTGEPRADSMARYSTTIELRRRDHNLVIAVADFHSETNLTQTVRIEPE